MAPYVARTFLPFSKKRATNQPAASGQR